MFMPCDRLQLLAGVRYLCLRDIHLAIYLFICLRHCLLTSLASVARFGVWQKQSLLVAAAEMQLNPARDVLLCLTSTESRAAKF